MRPVGVCKLLGGCEGVWKPAGTLKAPGGCENAGSSAEASPVTVICAVSADCRPDPPPVDEPAGAVNGGRSKGVSTRKVEQARSSRATASSSAQDIKMLLHSRELLKV